MNRNNYKINAALHYYYHYHFFKTIFSAGVPVLADIIFFKSPIVSSGLRWDEDGYNKYVEKIC